MMAREHQKLAAGRSWVVVAVASFEAIPPVFPLGEERFVLFLAADATRISRQTLLGYCTRLLNAGARCVCVWGPDCSRVHDVFDQAAAELGLDNSNGVVMTTWHDHEPLEEALWFAANAAFPHERYADAADALVALSVHSSDWESQIRRYLEAGTPILDEA